MAKIVVVKQKKEKTPTKKLNFAKISPKLIAQALVILAIFGVFIFALPMLPQKPTSNATDSYKGVINLWLVDSFEGGSGNRQSWFTSRSAQYEKQNKGLFVCVTALTESQLLENIQKGQSFDLLCFSRGVGSQIAQYLAPLDVDIGNLLDNFALAGRVNNVTYALPVYCGAYCLFARKTQMQGDLLQNCLTTTFSRKVGKNVVKLQPLVCGFAPYNSPLTTLAMSNVKGSAQIEFSLTQYTAYEQFVANKTAVTLLGTQRDICRLSQKIDMGKMEELFFSSLSNYNDLVQFVGVSKDSENFAQSQDFVKYLLSDKVQQTLVNVGMFSATNQSLYSKEWYSLCEQGLSKSYVPNVFAETDVIAHQRQQAKEDILVG